MKTFEPNKTITEMKEWDYVYVSDTSEEDALKRKAKRIFLRKCNNSVIYIDNWFEEEYLRWNTFYTNICKYAVPVPKLKTITLKVTEEQEREINNILNK